MAVSSTASSSLTSIENIGFSKSVLCHFYSYQHCVILVLLGWSQVTVLQQVLGWLAQCPQVGAQPQVAQPHPTLLCWTLCCPPHAPHLHGTFCCDSPMVLPNTFCLQDLLS